MSEIPSALASLRKSISSAELQDNGDDHAVEAEHLGEDKDEDESHEDLFVHAVALDALLTDEANRVASSDL